MGIQLLDANEFNAKLKVTIQSSGKMGITEQTTKTLGLTENSYIAIGQDDQDPDILYLVVTEDSERAFKVCKAGRYYYLPTRRLFVNLGLDFENRTIAYDLTRTPEFDASVGGTVYLMIRREMGKRHKK